MLRATILVAATLALAFGPTAATARADDLEDYWDRVRDQRERERDRYEDWLEDQRDAREDYLDRLRDQREDYLDRLEDQQRWNRRYYRGLPNYGYYPGATNFSPSYYGSSYYRGWQPGYSTYSPAWNYRGYDTYRPGGFSFRGPRGRGFSLRW